MSGVVEKQLVLDLLNIPGNNVCVDCGQANADWASWNLGCILCLTCSGVHRNMGVHLSRVKSVRLDNWKQNEYDSMVALGNTKTNEKWEACVPPGFQRPQVDDPGLLREQWIRCKYERAEFCSEDTGLSQVVNSPVPHYCCEITKQGAIVKSWRKRHMVVSGSMLTYRKKPHDVEPAGHVFLGECTGVVAAVEIPGHLFTFGLQVGARTFHISASSALQYFNCVYLLRYVLARLVRCQGADPASLRQVGADFSLQVKAGIPLAKRQFGKLVAECFLGSHMCDFLITQGYAASRQAAATLASSLLDQNMFAPVVEGTMGFKDGYVPFKWK